MSALDERVNRWHTEAGSDVALHEWLGLSWAEYQVLGRGDDALAAVLYARKHHVTLRDALALGSST
jgi:hypothetical protein